MLCDEFSFRNAKNIIVMICYGRLCKNVFKDVPQNNIDLRTSSYHTCMICLELVLSTFHITWLLYSLAGSLSQWLDTLGWWAYRLCLRISMAVQWAGGADTRLSLLVAVLRWSIHKTMSYESWRVMCHKRRCKGRYVFLTSVDPLCQQGP